MKRKIVIGIIIFAAGYCLYLMCFLIGAHIDAGNETEMLDFISQYDTNSDVVMVGDGNIYMSDCTIESDDNYLYSDSERLYLYSYDRNSGLLSVYTLELGSDCHQTIFSYEFEELDSVKMRDGQYVYVFEGSGRCFRYGIATGEYEYVDCTEADSLFEEQYSYEEKRISFWSSDTEITVTRKSDNVSKSFTTDDILQAYEAQMLDGIYSLKISTVLFRGDDVFILCHSLNISTVFEYDFETEQISFYAWRKVVDTEGLQLKFVGD